MKKSSRWSNMCNIITLLPLKCGNVWTFQASYTFPNSELIKAQCNIQPIAVLFVLCVLCKEGNHIWLTMSVCLSACFDSKCWRELGENLYGHTATGVYPTIILLIFLQLVVTMQTNLWGGTDITSTCSRAIVMYSDVDYRFSENTLLWYRKYSYRYLFLPFIN
jgi:hypothetical protein